MNLTRRGFLKLSGQAAAALAALPAGVRFFGEPDVEVLKYKDWIRDMGDYLQILIPSGKVLSGEVFDKPVLVGFGENSIMRECWVDGVANIFGDYGRIEDVRIDASTVAFAKPRPVLKVLENGYFYFGNLHLIGGTNTSSSIYLNTDATLIVDNGVIR